jgi:hypothetical protein
MGCKKVPFERGFVVASALVVRGGFLLLGVEFLMHKLLHYMAIDLGSIIFG